MPESTMTTETLDPTPAPGLFARFIGVITSPGETFKHVARTPKVAGMLFIISLTIGLSQGIPQFTERGKAAAFEMQIQQMERFTGGPVSDEMYEQMRQRSQGNFGAYSTIVGSMVGVPFMAVVITLVFWVVFNTILGGTASFKQVMAIVVHSQVISTLGAIVAAPIMYARGVMSTTGVANLGALIPMDETSFLARFFGMIDLFLVWWIVVLAIGLAVLYKRSTSGVATGLFIFYGLLVLGLAYFLG
jgi:hypothetical protein